jgi:hypothetical protein
LAWWVTPSDQVLRSIFKPTESVVVEGLQVCRVERKNPTTHHEEKVYIITRLVAADQDLVM